MKDKSEIAARLGIILCLLGVVLAVLSLYHHTEVRFGFQTGASFCTINEVFDCDKIDRSAWSYLWGQPLAAHSLAFYLALIVMLLGLAALTGIAGPLWGIIFSLSFLASVFSIYLFFVAKFIIGAICLLCLGMYLINFCLLGLAIWVLGISIESLGQGLVNIILWPFRALGFGAVDPVSRSQWRLLGLATLLACSAAFMSPEFIFLKFIYSSRNQAEFKEAIEDAFTKWQDQTPVNLSLNFTPGVNVDYASGSESAPIQLVEYSDFECPACRKFFIDLETLLKNYPDQVRIIHKNYPLDNSCNPGIKAEFHPHACFAAAFGRCAGEQGKFWEAVDMLYHLSILDDGGSSESIRAAILDGGEMLGLDKVGLEECLTADRTVQKIRSDIAEADKLGLKATPFVWVNGKFVEVAHIDVIKKIFEHIISSPRE